LLKKKKHSPLQSFLKPKSLLKDRYELIKIIGYGMSGEVYQAKDVLCDRYVAIKCLTSMENIEYQFFR
jgi:serine/threonine protein kinase